MVFKRRDKRPIGQTVSELFYPKGGWQRAASYVWHRLRRLPDAPHRIARGVFAGVFISFTPFFGLHFLGAALIAWLIRGNVLASILATFVGNPVTAPFIAISSVELGHWIMGDPGGIAFSDILSAFTGAWAELRSNFAAIYGPAPTSWGQLNTFFETVYLPYVVGGGVIGFGVGMGFYYATLPLLHGYQRLRSSRLKARFEKLRSAKQKSAKAAGWPEADAAPNGLRDARD